MSEIDVSDIHPAKLLAALYNAVSPSGMGFLQARNGDMTTEDAQSLLDGSTEETDYPLKHNRQNGKPAYFDYLHGRCLKVEINGKTIRPGLYDRDYGEGALMRIIETLRESA